MDNIQISIIIIIVLCILSLFLKKTAEKFACKAKVLGNNSCSKNWAINRNFKLNKSKTLCKPTAQSNNLELPIINSINNLQEDIFCLNETINDYLLMLVN